MSKHQIQLGRVRWASRREEGVPNPPREAKTSDANGGRNRRTKVYIQKFIKREILLAGRKRRRGRSRRRATRRQASNDRDRARRKELVIATHNVRTMAVDGKHGVGRAVEILDVYQEMDCDIIGLQETRRGGQSALLLRRASVARVNTKLQRYVGQLPSRTAALLILYIYSSLSSFEFDIV